MYWCCQSFAVVQPPILRDHNNKIIGEFWNWSFIRAQKWSALLHMIYCTVFSLNGFKKKMMQLAVSLRLNGKWIWLMTTILAPSRLCFLSQNGSWFNALSLSVCHRDIAPLTLCTLRHEVPACHRLSWITISFTEVEKYSFEVKVSGNVQSDLELSRPSTRFPMTFLNKYYPGESAGPMILCMKLLSPLYVPFFRELSSIVPIVTLRTYSQWVISAGWSHYWASRGVCCVNRVVSWNSRADSDCHSHTHSCSLRSVLTS